MPIHNRIPEEALNTIKKFADEYQIEKIYLFGSYARGEATEDSDYDLLVYGGKDFKLTMIFAFAEDLRRALKKDIDVFEIHEVNEESEFYRQIMKERIRVA